MNQPPLPPGPGKNPAERDATDSELLALIGAVVNETAAADERARLNEMLAASAAARQSYLEYINVHVTLRTYYAMTAEDSPATDVSPVLRVRTQAPKIRRWLAMFALAGLAAALLVAVNFNTLFPSRDQNAAPREGSLADGEAERMPKGAVARITRIAGAKWGEDRQTLKVATVLKPGLLHLAEGLAEIRLANGVSMVMEAPVQMRLIELNSAVLVLGRVVTLVPENARGFAMETPHARVVDLGTEFGVGVDDVGQTEVQVFQGEVVTECKDAKGKSLDQHLLAGGAVSIVGQTAPQDIPFQPQRFVRMFPTDRDGGQLAGPLYNRSRFDTVHVVPSPVGLKIDADLADWDRSGAFYSACFPPYHETHYVEGMLMYDARCLYVAAHVGDPAPMLSRMDPSTDPQQFAWRGGSVIIRMVVDREAKWPIDALGDAELKLIGPKRPLRPQDIDEKIIHLTLWYHQPSGKPRLQISHGMNFHGEQMNPPGFDGAFRRDPNGLGYTLEYAIPWSLLNVGDNPPRSGDELAANWTVHWSDQDGRLSRGHLVEITNSEAQPYRFLRGRTWGKAKYHAAGQLPPDTVTPATPPLTR